MPVISPDLPREAVIGRSLTSSASGYRGAICMAERTYIPRWIRRSFRRDRNP